MWPYGNHFRMDLKTIRPTHLTKDIGVACIFHQASQSSMRNQNRIIANLNYVGLLKEILLVDYFGLRLVLFKCSWIPFNLLWQCKDHCWDEHGFWQVNFQCWFPTMEPYVFPITISQVLTFTYEVPLENHTYKTQNTKWSINVMWFVNGSSGLDGLLVDWVGWFINGFVSSNICGNTKGVANNGNYVVVKN